MIAKTVSGCDLMLTLAFRVPAEDYEAIVGYAQDRGLLRGERLNLSAAAREVVSAGLQAIEEAGRGAAGDGPGQAS